MKFLRHLWEFVLDVLFPRGCVHCDSELKTEKERLYGVCKRCVDTIPISFGFMCPQCSRRFPELREKCHASPLSALFAATTYSSAVVRDLIRSAKYSYSTSSLRVLSTILLQCLDQVDFTPLVRCQTSHKWRFFAGVVIVPIPLHFLRENARGFNQAEKLSRSVYEFLGEHYPASVIRHEPKLLKRIKATRPQSETNDHKEREKNLQGAFQVRRGLSIVKGSKVILVDDVYTSGATMREAARVLKEAGAKKIVGVVVAKA